MLSIRNAFVPAVEPPEGPPSPAWWFLFREDRLLVQTDEQGYAVPFLVDPAVLGLTTVRTIYLGRLAGQGCYAAELAPDAPLPEGMTLQGIRGLYGNLAEDLFSLAGRAVQLVTWDRTHQFCGQCGTPTEHLPGERARKCPACGLTAYPRISPAVIVLVTHGDRILLARGRNFPADFYSTPAGFVEAGESLEEAVEREIGEELGVTVRDIRYFGSQPWPFPHQLMVGFTATWESGELQIDENELADAKWFTRDAMPKIPPRLSISRRLIDSYLEADA